MSRSLGYNREQVDIFFNKLEKLIEQFNLSPNRVFNMDETGLSIVQSKTAEIIALKGKRQIGAITSTQRGSLVIAVLCMSAGDMFIPQMLIFPRKNSSKILKKGAPPETLSLFIHQNGSKLIFLRNGSVIL